MQSESLKNSMWISFEFWNIKFFELELDINENLIEIKQIILDHFFTNFYENISFFINNKVIDISNPLKEYVNIKDKSCTIYLKLINYDKKSSLNHIKRVKEFIKNPETFKTLCNFEFKINCCQINYENIINSYENNNIDEYINQKVDFENKFDLINIFEKSYLHEIENIEKSINFEPLNKNLLKKFKIIKEEKINLEFRNSGIFYLVKVLTLENKKFTIGASLKGFKDLQEKDYYCSLIKLLSKKSELFEENLKKLDYDKINLDYLNPPIYLNNNLFFDIKYEISKNFKNLNQLTDTKSFFNKHSFQNRDWNEEIQQAKNIVLKNQIDNISKSRVIKKLQNDFLESFTKGIKLIGEKRLIPFSLSNKDYDQCFLYNNIFYTYVVDSDFMSSFSGPYSITTYKISSADINNLSFINYYNQDGIHYVASAIADYKGKRILGQALIHGINNYDSNTWVKHGIVEENNDIISVENYKKEIDKINKYFNLKNDLKYKNKNEETIMISGSPEIKGILANDKRFYLLDLIRFQVRDLNWTESKININDFKNLERFCNFVNEGNYEKKFGACLIRRELINNYFMTEAFTEYYKKIGEIKENKENEKIKENKKESKEENKVNVKDPEFKLSLKEKLFFNSTIETNYENIFHNEEERKTDVENLEKLSKFLLNETIPNFIKELNNNYIYKIINVDELTKMIHKFGINNRYLGIIYKKINEDNFNSQLILKSIILRCLKKYIRKIMIKVQDYELNSSLSFIFNLIFGDKNVITNLNEKSKINKEKLNNNKDELFLNYNENGVIIEENGVVNNNNKKKKNKKKNNIFFINEFTCLYSQELFDKILLIAKFYFKLEDVEEKFKTFEDFHFLNNHKNKMNFLFELCTSLGIKIQQRDYKFSNLHFSEFPFKSNDFVDFTIKIKNPFSYNEEYKNIINEFSQMIELNKIDEANELIINNLNLLLTINGAFNDEIITLMNNINKILIKKNEINKAIKYGFFILNLIKKFYGITSHLFGMKLIEIGDMFCFLKKNEYSIKFYLKALIIFDLIGNENNIFSINLISEIEKILSLTQIDINKIFLLPNNIKDKNSLLIYLLENCLKRIRNDKLLKFQINKKLFGYYLNVNKDKAIRLGIDQVCYLKKIENPTEQISLLINDYKKIINSLK